MDTAEILSKHFGIEKNKIINQGLLAFLEKKRSEILRTRIELLGKYGIKNAKELNKLIKEGKINEHPAWEDTITLENLEKELEVIEDDLKKIRKTI